MEPEIKKKSTSTPLITALWCVGVFLAYQFHQSPVGWLLMWGLIAKTLGTKAEKYRSQHGSTVRKTVFDILIMFIVLTLSTLILTVIAGVLWMARYGSR